LRVEVDLDALSVELLAVVDQDDATDDGIPMAPSTAARSPEQ
jgi:hypothetical protein